MNSPRPRNTNFSTQQLNQYCHCGSPAPHRQQSNLKTVVSNGKVNEIVDFGTNQRGYKRSGEYAALSRSDLSQDGVCWVGHTCTL